jgi:hypothetical protein
VWSEVIFTNPSNQERNSFMKSGETCLTQIQSDRKGWWVLLWMNFKCSSGTKLTSLRQEPVFHSTECITCIYIHSPIYHKEGYGCVYLFFWQGEVGEYSVQRREPSSNNDCS